MYRSVFVKASIRNVVLDDYIEDFKFERSDEKDDFLYLVLDGSRYADFQDAIVVGNSLDFKYGFISDFSSNTRSTRIVEINIKYESKMKITLKCLDLGNIIKKIVNDKVWKGKANEIAESIAKKYDLAFETQIGYKFTEYKALPQAFRTDFELLKYLAAKEGDIDIWINDGKLNFKARNLSQEPKRVYKYGEGKDVISVEVSYKSASSKPEEQATTKNSVTGQGTLEQSTILAKQQENVVWTGIKNDIKLGRTTNIFGEEVYKNVPQKDPRHPSNYTLATKVRDYQVKATEIRMGQVYMQVFDATGSAQKGFDAVLPIAKQFYNDDNINNFKVEYADRFGEYQKAYRFIHLPTASLENQNATKNDLLDKNNKANKKILTCELEIEMDIGINVGEIVRLEGLVSKHNGNWYVSEVQDSIRKSGGAITKLTLTRGKISGDSAKGNGNTNKKPTNFVELNSGGEGVSKKPILYNFNGTGYFGGKGFPQKIEVKQEDILKKAAEKAAKYGGSKIIETGLDVIGL